MTPPLLKKNKQKLIFLRDGFPKWIDKSFITLLTYSLNLITKVFVQQPLALPGVLESCRAFTLLENLGVLLNQVIWHSITLGKWRGTFHTGMLLHPRLHLLRAAISVLACSTDSSCYFLKILPSGH